jgi:hypothetical protein
VPTTWWSPLGSTNEFAFDILTGKVAKLELDPDELKFRRIRDIKDRTTANQTGRIFENML